MNRDGSVAAKYSGLISDLREAVFGEQGQVDPELRRSAASGDPLPDPWKSYVAKVRNESWDIEDSDIEDLKAVGRNEDEIFEMTVAAAVGASLRTLNAGLRALHAAG